MDPFTFFLIVSTATSTFSAVEGAKASRAARNAQRAEREQQNMRYAMERRDAIRKMRIAQATAMQHAENQGVGGSSGAAGGQGSIISQGNANLSFLDGSKQWADIAGNFMDKAAAAQSRSNMWGSLSQLAQTGMGMSATPDWFNNIFNPKPPGATIPSVNKGGSIYRGFSDVGTSMANIKQGFGF